MRTSDRVLVLGVVVAAVLIGLFVQRSGSVAMAEVQPAAAAPRIATVDMFAICEKYINQPEHSAPRDALLKQWQEKLATAEQELQALQQELQLLSPSDPQARVKQATMMDRQGKYQQSLQEGNAEVERFRAQQLIDAFGAARVAVNAVASRSGYTHVIAARAPDAAMTPIAMQFTIQEVLARSVVTAPAADDITAPVTAELKLP